MLGIESGSYQNSSKSGIALIIVVGFLAVLTIIAVGFSIAMRTEYMATSAYIDQVRSSQFLDVALSRALGQLDNEITNVYPRFNVRIVDPPANYLITFDDGGKLSPPFTANVSGIDTSSPPKDLLVGEALDFIPGHLRAAAQSKTNDLVWWKIAQPYAKQQYNEFDEVTNIVGALKEKMGRISYVIINCSGLLDANEVHRQNRWDGDDPGEIQIDQLISAANLINFITNRGTAVEYEHFPDLDYWGAGLDSPPTRFFPYSYFEEDLWFENGKGTNKINLMSAGLTNKAGVTNGFALSGIPKDPVHKWDLLYQNYADYVDEDKFTGGTASPADLNTFATESVPMINEVVVSNRLTYNGVAGANHSFTYELDILVEMYQPPATNDHHDYILAVPPTFNAAGGAGPVLVGGLVEDVVATSRVIQTKWDDYHVCRIEYEHLFNGIPAGVDITTINFGHILDTTLNLITVTDSSTGNFHDRVAGLGFIQTQIPNFSAPINPGDRVEDSKGYECIDLRLNHLVPGGWSLNAGANTLGDENGASAGVNEGPSRIYVRNGPMQNVAELGYLSMGQPWKTISLYDGSSPGQKMHRVLDVFSIGSKDENGLVNINTTNRDVLATALYKAAKDYPDTFPTPWFTTWPDVQNMADGLIAYTDHTNLNISALGRDFGMGFTSIKDLPLTDAEREGIIANSYRLFSTRGLLFTIIMAAQAVNEESGNALAEERAVALVWVDPLGIEKPFVRFMKRLKNW